MSEQTLAGLCERVERLEAKFAKLRGRKKKKRRIKAEPKKKLVLDGTSEQFKQLYADQEGLCFGCGGWNPPHWIYPKLDKTKLLCMSCLQKAKKGGKK